MFGVMEWGHNLNLAVYLNFQSVLCCLGKHFQATTMNETTVKATWMK